MNYSPLDTAQAYVTSRDECLSKICGVCDGCGGPLTAIETHDNAGAPTFWAGCEDCGKFSNGIEQKYVAIARALVFCGDIYPYCYISRADYEDTPERFEYFLRTQTSGLSHIVRRIDHMLQSS